MLQISVSETSKLLAMSSRRFCFFYRMGITLKQYSTSIPPRKLSAASIPRSNVAKTQPKRITEVLKESTSVPVSADESSRKLVDLRHAISANNSRDKGVHGIAGSVVTPVKQVPLHGAVDPRDLEWREIGAERFSNLPGHYLMLAKFRLTSLVVLTSVGGYVMAPFPLEIGSLLALAVGTGLVSSAANAVNQFLEAPFDAQMPRTRNRALVRGLLTPAHAVGFAVCCAISGSCVLWVFTNPTTTAFGLLNLLLYTSVYTPLKRVTIANTWFGSIVGAIPPLMGWTACSGGSLGAGAWLLAALLFAWQFPHFNALSWNLRQEYSRAGYRMMAVTNPEICRRTALRYSVGMLGLCLAAPVLDVTTWTFAFDSLPLNMYLTYLAWKFYKESDSRTSRKLFRFTLIHLPALMLLMLISKKHHSSDTKIPTDSESIQPENASLMKPGNGDVAAVVPVMPVAEKIVS